MTAWTECDCDCKAALIASWAVGAGLFAYAMLGFFAAVVFFACVYVVQQVTGLAPKTLEALGVFSLFLLALLTVAMVLYWWKSIYDRAKQDSEAEAAKRKREETATLPHGER